MKKILLLSTISLFFATTSLASDYEIPPRYATLWKNGVVQNLTCGTHSASANSVFVSGNDVYVVGFDTRGYRGSSPRTAMLWKNGVAQELISETDCTVAHSVFVSGNDVFVVGVGKFDIGHIGSDTRWRDYGNGIAILWKNGVEQKLTDGSLWSSALSVFVYNDDVYVLGHNGWNTVVLWKNGKEKYVIEGARAHSVFVSNNSVYISGREGRRATIWKNGIAEHLSDGDRIMSGQSIFVSNNDVYVVGYERYGIAKLWRNGELQNFDNGAHRSIANSVFVFADNIYIAGQNCQGATLWKNGVAQTLASDESRWGQFNSANSVFVSDDGDVYVVGHTKSSRW